MARSRTSARYCFSYEPRLVIALLLLGVLPACDLVGGNETAGSTSGSIPSAGDSSRIDDLSWIAVAPGSFVMGSPDTERCREADEASVRVNVKRGFVISAREVTQRMFREAMGYNPSFRRACDTCPVDSVTQHEAAAFCNAISERSELSQCYRCSGSQAVTRCEAVDARLVSCRGYRLPTEAEWEYAARAGSRSATYIGDIRSCMAADAIAERVAWYKVSSKGRVQPGGQKQPNRWGLFDTLGNVYEWTADWYSPRLEGGQDPLGPQNGSERVLRGGSWYHNAEHARSANRYAFRPEKRLSYVGFRCARSIVEASVVGG